MLSHLDEGSPMHYTGHGRDRAHLEHRAGSGEVRPLPDKFRPIFGGLRAADARFGPGGEVDRVVSYRIG